MHKLFQACLVVSVLATPAFARVWTARTGGFTVEAELLDVKAGKAILQRTDGKQISVDLNKLSLGDVRYIQQTLASAEAAVLGDGVKSEPVAGKSPAAASESRESPQEETPPAAGDGGWEASGNPDEWGSQTELTVGDPDELTFGPAGCTVVVAGRKIWDAAKKRIRGELDGEIDRRGLRVISPDGRWFAAADKSPNQRDTSVGVWDLTTGKKRFSAPGDSERYADVILLSNERLFIGGRLSESLSIWDLQSGQQEKTLELPNGAKKGSVGLTLDGKYLATPAKDRMVVLRVESGKVVATMGPPKKMERSPSPDTDTPPGGRTPGARSRTRRQTVDSNRAVFVYAWLQSVKFSPDAKELAVVSTNPAPRVICWSNQGKLVYDEPFYSGRRAFWENTLQWFPDRGAWLIANDVFDRASGRIVLSIRERFAQDLAIHVLDDNHLVGTFPDSPSQVEVLPIPWEGIRQSLALMEQQGAALLSPADPVGLKIELGSLRGNQTETIDALTDALEQRLRRDGLKLAEDRPAFFRLKFAETAGDLLPIYERQSPFSRQGHDTGRKATEAKGSLVLELIVPDQPGPIWRETISVSSSRSFHNETINDATLRKSMLENVRRQLNYLSIPYFIPQDEKLLALPVVLGG